MNTNRWALEEKVRICLLRYRGDILQVSKVLDLPVEFVQKVQKKFKGKMDRGVSKMIADNMSVEIILGRNQRILFLVDMIKSLESREQLIVSLCCNVPTNVTLESSGWVHICKRCGKQTNTILIDRDLIYTKKIELIQELREEDITLVDFLVKMGFTNLPPATPANIIKQTQVIITDKELTSQEKNFQKSLKDMEPLEIERVIKLLEKKEDEIEEEKEEGKSG